MDKMISMALKAPMVNALKTGDSIVNLMAKHSISNTDLSRYCDVSDITVSKWRNGRAIPKIDYLVAMTALFNVTLDEILVYD